jgi:hypothetical protein
MLTPSSARIQTHGLQGDGGGFRVGADRQHQAVDSIGTPQRGKKMSDRNAFRKEVVPYLMDRTTLRHDGVTGIFLNASGDANGQMRGKTQRALKQQRNPKSKPLLARLRHRLAVRKRRFQPVGEQKEA